MIVKQRFAVHRLVELAVVRVDADLAEQSVQPEGAGFVGNDRHDTFADVFVAQQMTQQPHEGHGGGSFAAAGAFEKFSKTGKRRYFQRLGFDFAFWQETAQGLAPFEQILCLGAVKSGTIKRRIDDLLVADRDIEPGAEFAKFLFVELFLLVRNVAALARFAQAVAFDGLGENDGGLTLVFHRGFVGGIHLARVVTTAEQFANLVVGQVIHQLEQFGVFTEEMFARMASRLDRVFLIIAVHRFLHALQQKALRVLGKQFVPIRAPDDFDDIPARAAEGGFEFLNDLAVAAHRAVESLQIAIHDPDQVVEILARRERERAKCFRFVRFAVAHERPDLRFLRPLHQPARLQVAIEPRLINRDDRAETHGYRGELPEVRHQIRMRIRRQSAALGQFLPEILEVALVQSPFEKGARVIARCGVALEEDHVGGTTGVAGVKEMVVTDLVKCRQRRIGGDVASKPAVLAIGVDHHRHRVPADVTLDADFRLPIARKPRLLFNRNRVDVRGADRIRRLDARRAQAVHQVVEEEGCLFGALGLEHLLDDEFERLQPLFSGGVGFAAGLVQFRFHFQSTGHLAFRRRERVAADGQFEDDRNRTQIERGKVGSARCADWTPQRGVPTNAGQPPAHLGGHCKRA